MPVRTDTMGSVRLPAAHCGIYGFKPSQDAIATAGVVPLSFTLDAVGPLARSAEEVVRQWARRYVMECSHNYLFHKP